MEKYAFLKNNLIITGRDGAFIVKSDGLNCEYYSVSEKESGN